MSPKEEYDEWKIEIIENNRKYEEYTDKYPTLRRSINNDFFNARTKDIEECFKLINNLNDIKIIYEIIKEHLIKRFNREELIFL